MAKNKKTVMIVIPPDGGFGWIVVFAAFWLAFVVDGCMMVFSIYKASLKEDLQVDEMAVMSIYSSQMGIHFLSGPLNSLIIQCTGFRASSIIGILTASLGYTIASLTTNYHLTLIAYGLVSGFGAGVAFQAAVIMVSYYFEKYRAIATGIVMCGSALGGFAVSITLTHVLDHFGRANTFRFQAGFMACSLLCVLAFRMPPMTEIQVDNDDDAMAAAANPYMSTVSLGKVDDTRRRFPSFFVEPRVEPQKSIWQRYCRCFSCGASNAKVDYTTRPLDRQDIFFGGSVADLERIASRSMDTRPLSRPHVATSRHVGFKIERTCKICPASLGQMLVKMLDIRLFKSPTFCVLLLALFMWMLGLYIPYNYVVDRASYHGIDLETSKVLLPIVSLGNIIGRILAGLSSFTPQLNATFLVATCSGVAGTLTVASAWLMPGHSVVQFAYGIAYGIFVSFTMVLRSVLYVQYMGLENLTSVYGIASMTMGIAALSGTYIAQAIQSNTGGYVMTFLFPGFCHLACSASFVLLHLVNRWERHR